MLINGPLNCTELCVAHSAFMHIQILFMLVRVLYTETMPSTFVLFRKTKNCTANIRNTEHVGGKKMNNFNILIYCSVEQNDDVLIRSVYFDELTLIA